jgi:hypothetical protein
MGIDIFSIQPSVISRDLSGKSFLIYGTRKSGKTSNAVKFPKPIVLGFEKGWNMLSGVYGQPINKWSEALTVKKQLLKDVKTVENGEKTETTFKTVVVDTADLAYMLCEDSILEKEGVEYLDETESKRGYKAVKKEFNLFFQDIVKAGYTLVVVAHSETKQIKENGEKYERTQPLVDKRGFEVLAGLVDVIGFATNEIQEDGMNKMILTLRGNQYLEAGTRNKYMSEKIPFTYSALLADMEQAIDKLAAEDGAVVSDKPIEVYKEQTEVADFKETVARIGKIAKALNDQNMMDKYQAISNGYLGKGKLVRDCDASQINLLMLILDDLEDLVKEQGILMD